MKKTLLASTILLVSINSYAEPTWYGNLNMNINAQENYNPLVDDMYMDSNYSYLGIAGQEKVKGNQSLVKSLKYRVEYALDINNKEESLVLNQAVGALDMMLGTVLIGHQNPIQRDILLKPMDVFNASRVIAHEESGYVNDVIDNTIRLDTRIMGMYLGISASMNNSDPNSDNIDSYSVGLATKNQNSQYGLVYWEDNDGWEDSERVGYWGANASYTYGIWAASVSLVKPTVATMAESSDIAIVMKMADGMSAKTKYGKLDGKWDSYGFGIESKLTTASKWYLEYQKKEFVEENFKNQSLTSFGINYKF